MDLFELPVPLQFSSGQRDTIIVVEQTARVQTFRFPIPFQASTLALDPELHLLSKPANIITRVPVGAFGDPRPVLYPNPTTGQAVIYFDTALQGPAEVRVTTGRDGWCSPSQDRSKAADFLTGHVRSFQWLLFGGGDRCTHRVPHSHGALVKMLC